ncbi:cytochrome o ubiquinol oxidase subunit IV [Tabrizicola sp. J26]|uniref:cytochrome o ubiquinol oxidase subunit IV n=1 Tax=Alitabrizicola rongguiensis TaxID=2909234 RepID=UPI001F43BFDC|nr:cytochrome o ubiquinol oxidase subunit IV [Tabrizicola rongguiensis]MCF1709419.1 cytochrome o ubiquinol oxidase subunit IV [Tabrizicola rongguiensis]
MSEFRRDVLRYLVGAVLCAWLTLAAFAAIILDLPRTDSMAVIAVAAIAQIVVQLFCFLHIDLNRRQREDLLLILFSILQLAIMIGGTIWVMTDLHSRM